MIDFLNECNININTINEMKKKYPAELFDLNCNKEEIVQIIDYLRNIGITNIDDLLLNKTSLFFKSKELVEQKFMKYDLSLIVNQINEDYEKIDKILFDYN